MKGAPPIPVRLDDIRRYILLHGWRQKPHANERIAYFTTDSDQNGDFFSLILPASETVLDAANRSVDALQILAEFEGKAFSEIVQRIRSWDKDVLRARILERTEPLSSLPLDEAAEAILRLKQLVGYVAYTEVDPKPHFEKAGAISNEFSKACRFGHTFEGSFGFSIECPLPSLNAPLPLEGIPQEVPFERQVMERIAVGLSDLRTATEADDIGPIVQNYHLGFNANICQTLAEIYEQMDGRRIEYDFVWCAEISTEVAANWKPFILQGRAHEILKEAARVLEKTEEQPDTRIQGRIVQLKSDVPPGQGEQGEFEHIITVVWEREKAQPLKVRVPLNPEEYRNACDAHKDGKRIQIAGVPEKQGKFWVLTKPHGFTVV
ncbi:MAG: hypothetical protein JO170_32225 [Verrucomicrobia bacterium]|nr:hypothetical protein [Verrucomicrobiota bacterium]